MLQVENIIYPVLLHSLTIDGLVKLGRRLRKLTRCEEFLSFRFDIAPLLPKRGGFEAAQAGI